MKSKMKKTIASLLTAAIATMSFGSMMTANAASYNKTFRIYYSLKTNNSGVSKMTSQLKYNYNIVEVKSYQGKFRRISWVFSGYIWSNGCQLQ